MNTPISFLKPSHGPGSEVSLCGKKVMFKLKGECSDFFKALLIFRMKMTHVGSEGMAENIFLVINRLIKMFIFVFIILHSSIF